MKYQISLNRVERVEFRVERTNTYIANCALCNGYGESFGGSIVFHSRLHAQCDLHNKSFALTLSGRWERSGRGKGRSYGSNI